MSRSRKSIGHITATDKFGKKYANKKYRRRPLNLTDVKYKKYTEIYDFRDYIYRNFGVLEYKEIMK